jgi:hypothetical protein
MQSRQVLPSESLGQVAATGRTYAQHALTIPNDTNNISICLLVEATQSLGCKVEAHLVPTIPETWAPHTASGFYIGNAWDHYRCHKIYINDTQHTRNCNTVFFKHKYLALLALTCTDALIQAADNLTSAIAGAVPPPNMTMDAIDQLMQIFKQQAETTKNNVTI